MRLHLRTREPSQIEFGLIYSGIAAAAVILTRILPMDRFMPSCIFKGITGMPCPTCGATRSVMFLSHGDILHSLAMNPLVCLGLLSACLLFPYYLIAFLLGSQRIRVILSEREKSLLPACVIVFLAFQWIYLILFL